MIEKITPFDPAEMLDSPEAIKIFLDDAFETKDQSYIDKALKIVERAKKLMADKDSTI